MRCEQSATWTFRLSDGATQVRVQMAIIFQTPIPGEDLVSVSILAPWELFPDELPWEAMQDASLSHLVNGFHGRTGLSQSLPICPQAASISK